MKVFDSGMPDEAYWQSLFDIPAIVDWLNMDRVVPPVVEIGCGYGTFTLPVAGKTAGEFYAFDVEASMVERTRQSVRRAGLRKVHVDLRDVIDHGTGLEPESAGLVLLFNILHSPERRILLAEASRILRDEGVIAIIHWRKDIPTPRGPGIESRPDKQTILDSAAGLDLRMEGGESALEPYHWGMRLVKGRRP